MKSRIFQVVASALLFSAVQGHMLINSPVPYGPPPPDNGPLDPSGSNFPCGSGGHQVVTENIMAIGETQTLSFTGTAVHSGGSCQLSLTTDRSPTKASKWMVIKSIEGGCPSKVNGNISPADAASTTAADKFQYTIPEGIPPGKYTIAWTWINKTGNREFYMQCAPATVTAAKKKRYAPQGLSLVRKQSSFPDMFVANLAGINSCTTTEGFDYHYPNPGAVVQQAGTGPFQQLTCGAAGGSNPAPAPAASAPAASAPVISASTVAASPPAASALPSGGLGGVFASGAASVSTAATSAPAASAPAASAPVVSAAPIPSVSSPAAPVPAAPAPSASAAPASGTSADQQTQGTACSPEGQWLCLGKSYQRCASGLWSPVMPLAAGMSCTPGMSGTLSQYPGKRSTGSWVRRADSFRG